MPYLVPGKIRDKCLTLMNSVKLAYVVCSILHDTSRSFRQFHTDACEMLECNQFGHSLSGACKSLGSRFAIVIATTVDDDARDASAASSADIKRRSEFAYPYYLSAYYLSSPYYLSFWSVYDQLSINKHRSPTQQCCPRFDVFLRFSHLLPSREVLL